jgi:hypothetical protein
VGSADDCDGLVKATVAAIAADAPRNPRRESELFKGMILRGERANGCVIQTIAELQQM